MALNEQDIVLIEAYVAGRLSDEEAGEVVARMGADAEFREEVEVAFGAEVVRGVGRRAALRGALERVEGEVAREGVVGRRWAFGVAAAVLVLLVVGWGVWDSRTAMTGEEVFAERFEADDWSTGQLGGGTDSDLREAIDAYKNKQFEVALEGFGHVKEGDTLYKRVRYWSGICYLGVEKVDQGLIIFDEIIADDGNPLRGKALWYKGLGLLAKGDEVEAKVVFDLILDEGGYGKREEVEGVFEDMGWN